MSRLFTLAALVAAAFGAALASPTRAAAEEPLAIFKGAIGGVVYIENHIGKDTLMGSGFLVDARRRLVVTNYHVADGEETMDVYFPVRNARGDLIGSREHYRKNRTALAKTGHYAAARVVAQAPNKDLVVLELDALPANAVALELATADPAPGDGLHILGNPAGRDLWRWTGAFKPKLGSFRGKYGDYHVTFDYKQITYAASGYGGNSGGPVLNDDGRVVGVHSSGGGEGGINGGAVHFAEVADLLGTVTSHRVFSVKNPTGVTLHYQVRWGDGEWKESKIEPGKVIVHWSTGEGEPKIRFDRSAEAGYQEKLFTLDAFPTTLGRGVSPSSKDGKEYYFEYDPSGQNLNLYGVKK